MKKKMQSLFAIVLIGAVLPMQGMMRSGTRVAGTLSQRTAQLPKQTWGQWFRSLLPRSQSTRPAPVASSRITSVRTTASPFTPMQSSGYHTTVPQKSFWDKFTSIFAQKPSSSVLTIQEIDKLAWGSYDEKERRPLFNSDDLEAAKQKLGTMIEEHPEYKDKIIQKWEYSIRFSNYRNPEFTLLDKIFYFMLVGDYNGPGVVTMNLSDRAVNQTKLIKHLMDKGARINTQNAEMYKKAYFAYLMPSYKRLYGPNPASLYGADNEIQTFKQLFKELDPILEEIIPGFKEEAKEAQQERADIEANPDEYKKKVEEEKSRAEYMYLKARRMSDDHNRNVGDAYASYPYDFADKVQFDKQEYQAWIKSGKPDNFFNRYKTNFNFEFEQNNFNQDMPFQQQGKAIWDVLPGLSINSSKSDIGKAYRKFMQENHPDKIRNLSEDERKKREERTKEVNASWDEYNEQLKQQQATE